MDYSWKIAAKEDIVTREEQEKVVAEEDITVK